MVPRLITEAKDLTAAVLVARWAIRGVGRGAADRDGNRLGELDALARFRSRERQQGKSKRFSFGLAA